MKKKRKIVSGKKGRLKKILVVVISILLLITIIANVQSIGEEVGEEVFVQETQTTEIQDDVDTASQPIESGSVQESSGEFLIILPIDEPASDTAESGAAEIQDGADIVIPPIEEPAPESSTDSIIVLPIDEPASDTGPITETPAEDPSGDSLTGGTLAELPIEEPVNETETVGDGMEAIGNETGVVNQTENGIGMLPEQNETTNETALPGTMEGIIDILPQPNLDLQLNYPSKIIRGEPAQIKAITTNSGMPVTDLQLQWVLPEGFEILLGSSTENCGDLNTEESCTSIISIRTLTSTSLGINKIKIMASYKQ